ncbi:MAG: hypothetical protein NXI31_10200 [bacterium]|nr:hypothetical protein [bacterium]
MRTRALSVLATISQPRGVMRFDGNAWTRAGALNDWPAVLANDTAGNVYAAGRFTQDGSQACRYLGRWDGNGWQPLAGGAPISVGGLAISPRGDVFAGGAEDFLLHRTACPATASSFAPGCSGGGGPNELQVSTLPLIGGIYRAEATGLPTSALAFELFGLHPASQPLINLVPFGVPGCTVAVTPVVSVSRLASGSFTTTLAITNDPAWIGTTIRHQVLVGELGGPGFLAATVTNAIAAVLGRAY